MSEVSAVFSSSSRSMRSTSDFNCPAAKPDLAIAVPSVPIPKFAPCRYQLLANFGIERTLGCPTHALSCDKPQAREWEGERPRLAVSLLTRCLRKLRLLFRRGVPLIALFPFRRRHAVDDFARLVLFQDDAFFGRGFAIPIAQAVTAEAGKVHHIDVLNIGARAQMGNQVPERGGFQFGAGFLIHGRSFRDRLQWP